MWGVTQAHLAVCDAAAAQRVPRARLAAVELRRDLRQRVARGGLLGQPLRGGVGRRRGKRRRGREK